MSSRIYAPLKHVSQALGQNTCTLSIITSAIVALTSFFYIFTVGSYFKITVYILQNRVVYINSFTDYVFNEYFDHIVIVSMTFLWLVLSINTKKIRLLVSGIYGILLAIAILTNFDFVLDVLALVSIPIVIFFLICNKIRGKIEKEFDLIKISGQLTVNYLATIGIVTGFVSIVIALVRILFATSFPSENYAYDIFLFFSSSSSVLLFLLIFCLPVKLLLNEYMPRILKLRINKRDLSPGSYGSIKKRTKIVYLVLFMVLSVIMVLIPHQATINKDSQEVGVDTHYYVDWVNELAQSNTSQEYLRQLFTIQNGDRPLSLLFLYTIVNIVNANPFFTLEVVVPIIFGPALVLVTYFLTREITPKDDSVALFAAFLTSISFQTLIGIYAGFYANWFAIIIGYLSVLFLFRFLKMPSRLNLTAYSVLLVMLLFTHVYTWTILVLVTTIFLLVMLRFDYFSNRNIILLLLIVIASVVIDVAKWSITGAAIGIEQDIHVARVLGGTLLENYSLRTNNMIDTQTKFAGQFSNFIILILGVYWIFVSDLRRQHTIFLVVFLSIGILPLFFGNWLIQSRIFYDIPFQIPAAIALSSIKNKTNGSLLLLPVCIWLIAMAVRAVSNYYLILPS